MSSPQSPDSAQKQSKDADIPAEATTEAADKSVQQASKPIEVGGPKGLEPTRYGDWEQKGRCIDF